MQGTEVENRLFSVNSIAFLEAAQAGNLEKLRALREAGAYIHALRSYDKRNALDLAARAGLACIRYLHEELGLAFTDPCVFFAACIITPVDLDTLGYLSSHGLDVNYQAAAGYTALFMTLQRIATSVSFFEDWAAQHQGEIAKECQLAKFLISLGAKLDIADEHGRDTAQSLLDRLPEKYRDQIIPKPEPIAVAPIQAALGQAVKEPTRATLG